MIDDDRPTRSDGRDMRDMLIRTYKKRPFLKYSFLPLVLALFYIFILVVPWIMIGLLSVRTWSGLAYDDQTGSIYPGIIEQNEKVWLAADILNQFSALLALPIIGFLIARFAAVYTQRRTASQSTNIRQTFALADRRWLNPFVLYASRKDGSASIVLDLAFLFVLITVAQQVTQRALVRPGWTTVVTCNDYVGLDYFDLNLPQDAYSQCTYDNNRADFVAFNRNISDFCSLSTDTYNDLNDLNHRFIAATENDNHRTLWVQDDNFYSQKGYYSTGKLTDFLARGIGYFISNVPKDLDTGVKRQQAMRLNNSVSCTITEGNLPSPCPGSQPFTWAFNGTNEQGSPYDAHLCVPGDYKSSPWAIMSNRQDVSEELYFQLNGYGDPDTGNSPSSKYSSGSKIATGSVIHCVSNSTLGFFELPNFWNEYTTGPLINTQTDPGYMYGGPNVKCPQVLSDPRNPNYEENVSPLPGPLTTSVLTLFGNYSWILAAANNSISFQANYTEYNSDLDALIADSYPLQDFWSGLYPSGSSYLGNSSDRIGNFVWQFFNSAYGAQLNLEAALVYTSEYLISTTNNGDGGDTPSPFLGSGSPIDFVYTAPGESIVRPEISTGALIGVSVLIGVEVLAILLLVFYGSYRPTWTRTLDAFAMARIGADLQRHATATTTTAGDGDYGTGASMPPLRQPTVKDLKSLEGISGVVGAEPGPEPDAGAAAATAAAAAAGDDEAGGPGAAAAGAATGIKFLVTGAPGVVSRRMRYLPSNFEEDGDATTATAAAAQQTHGAGVKEETASARSETTQVVEPK